MKLLLTLVQIILAVVVSALILIQAKGTGLGRTFGSGTYHSKRGMEFVIFRMTILLAVLFILTSVINQLFS
jgi:preprotein translocase subunit SecG